MRQVYSSPLFFSFLSMFLSHGNQVSGMKISKVSVITFLSPETVIRPVFKNCQVLLSSFLPTKLEEEGIGKRYK